MRPSVLAWYRYLCHLPLVYIVPFPIHASRSPTPSTTGFRFFAECLRHSAKAKLHSAKALPSAALGKEHTAKIDRQSLLCRVSFVGHSAKALPSAPGTLGKEKRPSRRQSRWRSLCRVPTRQALGKDFLFFFKNFLCRVPTLQALGKEF